MRSYNAYILRQKWPGNQYTFSKTDFSRLVFKTSSRQCFITLHGNDYGCLEYYNAYYKVGVGASLLFGGLLERVRLPSSPCDGTDP